MSETNRDAERTRAARADVPNAGRASNDEMPRSAAVAEHLGHSAEIRAVLIRGTRDTDYWKDLARKHLDSARDINGPRGTNHPDFRETVAERRHDAANATQARRDDYAAGEQRHASVGRKGAMERNGVIPSREARAAQGFKEAKESDAASQKRRPTDAADYWAAKIARGAGRAEGAPAQAQEQKEGARRGMVQRAG